MESTRITSCQSERATDSAPKPCLIGRPWQSDAEYLDIQDRESSWSHSSIWGQASASKFVKYGHMIADLMFHDDQVADFGGNDGFAAYNFYMVHKVKPLVVDCSQSRLEYADRVFHLPTYETFIESMPELKDKFIDWAYSSHTIEHTRDPEKALREIARVVKRQCFFVLPIESASHAEHRNHAHTCSFSRPIGWKRFMEQCGWKVIRHGRVGKHEAQFIAEPR